MLTQEYLLPCSTAAPPRARSAPVQTFHRVLLTAPKGEKGQPQSQHYSAPPPPPTPPPSTRSDDRSGPRAPPLPRSPHGTSISKSGSFSNPPARSNAALGAGRGIGGTRGSVGVASKHHDTKSSGFRDSRLVDSRGSGGSGSGRGGVTLTRGSSSSNVVGGGEMSSPFGPSDRGGGGIASASQLSSSMNSSGSRIPPMLISASGGSSRHPTATSSGQPHRNKGATGGVGGGGGGARAGQLVRKDSGSNSSRHSVTAYT